MIKSAVSNCITVLHNIIVIWESYEWVNINKWTFDLAAPDFFYIFNLWRFRVENYVKYEKKGHVYIFSQ